MSALRVFLGVLLAGMAFSSFASTYPNRDAVRAVAMSGSTYVYWPDKPGSAVRVGGAVVEAGASNWPTVVRNNLPVPVPGGGTIPAAAKVAATARAIGKTLYRALPYIAAAGLVSDVAGIWSDIGYPVDSSGVPTKLDPGAVPSDGYLYRWSTWQFTGPFVAGRQAACDAAAQFYASLNGWNTRGELEGTYCGIRLVGAHIFVGSTLQSTTSGACPAGQYPGSGGTCSLVPPGSPVSEQEFLDEIATRSGWPSGAALALQKSLVYPPIADLFDSEVGSSGVSPSVQLKDSSGASVPSGTPVPVGTPKVATRNYSDPSTGAPMTETKTSSTTATATGNQVTYNTSTVTTITNNTTNVTETVQTEEKPAEEVETCGLPGKAECAIDEKNTAEVTEEARARHDPQQDATDAYNPLKEFLENAESALPEFPTINWAFTLPTGCAAIALPAFEPFLQQIDVCQFQPMFHDVMSLVWLMGGLFGAIGTFWRNTFATS